MRATRTFGIRRGRRLAPAMQVGRLAGRVLLTAAGLGTIVGPLSADLTRSHVFNERWPSHARFHGVVGVVTAATLAAFGLWRLWAPLADRRASRDLAAAVPIAYWGSFLPAALVRGTGLDDPPHAVGRILGVPSNVFWASLLTTFAGVGWVLDRTLGGQPLP